MKAWVAGITLLLTAAPVAGGVSGQKGKSVQHWVARLENEGEKDRVGAAVALGDLGPRAREAVGALRKALAEPDSELRHAAVQALGRIGPAAAPAAADLAKALRERDPLLRAEAARSLAAIGPKARAAVPMLLLALDDREPAVAREAVRALTAIGLATPEVVTTLLQTLRESEVSVRREAALALRELASAEYGHAPKDPGRTKITKALALSLATGAVGVIARNDLGGPLTTVARLLNSHLASAAKEAPPDHVTLGKDLAPALEDEDAFVRANVADTLADLGHRADKAVPFLLKATGDRVPTVRRQAILALAAIAPEDAKVRRALAKALADRNPQVRLAAAAAEGRMGFLTRALPVLTQALGDEDPLVRAEAATILGRLGPQAKEAVPALAKALKGHSPAVRREAALALFRIDRDAKQALPILLQGLKEKADSATRGEAAAALGELGAEAAEAIPELLHILGKGEKSKRDVSPFVRREAVRALGKIGPAGAKVAVGEIRLLLPSKDAAMRVEAALALLRLGAMDEEAEATLRNASGDPDAAVRVRAVVALRAARLTDMGALRALADDPSPAVRRAARGQAQMKGQQP